jgi:F-type H+-transporting ATPase subunit epsilon
MNVEILTPDKTLFSGDAEFVTLPGSNGSFQVFENHAPLIANLGKGTVSIKSATGLESFAVNGGLVEVLKNKVVVLV